MFVVLSGRGRRHEDEGGQDRENHSTAHGRMLAEAHLYSTGLAIVPGTRVGVYEVTSALGAGGMGEVYRARDSRLDRDIALKILPESFAGDADRLMRFGREAKTRLRVNRHH